MQTTIAKPEAASAERSALTPRWQDLVPLAPQRRLWFSRARFRVCPAGRRSGKSELAKRFVLVGEGHFRGALTYDLPFDDGWFVCSAPTHKQAKRIFWQDLKSMVPRWARRKVHESDLTIKLYNGAELSVVGMDAPDRIEGRSIDGMVLDEYGNMKPDVWDENIRPALSTRGRPGWAWLIGVPEGRNHYWEVYKRARDGGDSSWSAHSWPSKLVLPPEEVEQARRDMDELTFQQEYEASFVNFTGRAYYAFGDHNKSRAVELDLSLPLVLCFDFNASPGVCAAVQVHSKEDYAERGVKLAPEVADEFVAAVGEVWIPKHSNTKRVCEKAIELWGEHPGKVLCYGDATGGAKGSSAVEGSDWEIIEQMLTRKFGDRLEMMNGKSNPRERQRVNAVNSLCKSADGEVVRLLVNPKTCGRLVDDLDGVRILEGTAGEIDKESDKMLTHISDAFGYYAADEHPIDKGQKFAQADVA